MQSNLEQHLLKDIDNLRDKNFVRGLDSVLGPEYKTMLEDSNGEEVLKVGVTLIGFLLPLFKKDIELGMRAAKVILCGYPNYPHTDLLCSYYESDRTRSLWVSYPANNAKDAEIVINAYFRWYVATYEYYRNLLVFDCYCNALRHDKPINLERLLFNQGDPAKTLQTSADKKDGEILVEYYNSTLRHVISHGTIILVPGTGVIFREVDSNRTGMTQKIWSFSEFLNEINIRFGRDIEVVFGASRLFWYLYRYLIFVSNAALSKKFIEPCLNDDPALALVLKSLTN